MKIQSLIFLLTFSFIFFSCKVKTNNKFKLPQIKILKWESKHFDISVKYTQPWKKNCTIDSKDTLMVTFFNNQNGSELTILIEPAPPDPHPETLLSITPMNAVYKRILSAHPNNRNLQKATDTKINNYEYECHPFEVYSEKWGMRNQNYYSRWLGKLFMIVILTYKKENANEMREFETNYLKLFEN